MGAKVRVIIGLSVLLLKFIDLAIIASGQRIDYLADLNYFYALKSI